MKEKGEFAKVSYFMADDLSCTRLDFVKRVVDIVNEGRVRGSLCSCVQHAADYAARRPVICNAKGCRLPDAWAKVLSTSASLFELANTWSVAAAGRFYELETHGQGCARHGGTYARFKFRGLNQLPLIDIGAFQEARHAGEDIGSLCEGYPDQHDDVTNRLLRPGTELGDDAALELVVDAESCCGG